MIETIWYAAMIAVEAVVAWIYCERLFFRKRKNWILVLVYIVTYATLFLISMLGNTTLNSISFGIMNFALFVFAYQVKYRTAFLHSAFLCFIMLIAEVIVSLIINLFGHDFTEYTHNVLIMIILGIWSKLLYLILAVICARLFSPCKYETEEPSFFVLFCILPLVSALIAAAIIYIGMHSEVDQTVGAMMAINISSLLIINLLFLSIYNHLQKMHAEQLQTKLRIQKEEDDALYYQMLQKQADSQQILVHDIKNHIHAIKRLAEQGETDEIVAYLSQIDKTVLSIPKTRICNEPVLNILLLRFMDDCKKADIVFFCDVRGNCLTMMDSTSITALFSNLLSNAFEAAILSKEKEIELTVRYSDMQAAVVILVKNSCETPPTIDINGGYTTNKKDRNKHGIGLKSIQRIVQKYQGLSTAQYVPEKREFHHIIHIPFHKS